MFEVFDMTYGSKELTFLSEYFLFDQETVQFDS